jgi:Rod binding domain-containing protein
MVAPLNLPVSQLTAPDVRQLNAKATRVHHDLDKRAETNGKLQQVAKQFESVLMGQLLEVMFKSSSTLGGEGGQSDLYRQMYQGPLAEHLVSGGGLGLAKLVARGLGATDDKQPKGPAELPAPMNVQPSPVGLPRTLTLDPAHAGVPTTGAMLDVQRAAADMLADGGAARWAKDGALTPQDLGANAAVGGAARAGVQNANGYQGYYKCNLFALEVARRAGLQVPGTGDARLSYPSTNRLTQDASDGVLETGWAKVVTGASPTAMQDALQSGEAAFLLVGSGTGERHGHMAVVERPKSIEYDADGQVQRVVFDGWEAQPSGARHLTERAWNRVGNPGNPGDRNGLSRIEIIQLSRPAQGTREERSLSDTAKTSQLDSVSSNEPRRPTQGGKEHS